MGGTIQPPGAALLQRVRGEYMEMPGLRLTIEQAGRLWALDRDTCSSILAALVGSGFLQEDRTGRFMRTHGGY